MIFKHVCVNTLTLRLLGCAGMEATAAGMCSAVRRLLIGYFTPLSGRLYCCSGQRKSRGERIISQLIPTLPISHHSLPQTLIYRRVNSFSLFSLFWVTNSLFPLLLFRIAQHYRRSFPGIEHWAHRERGRESTCCEIPRRRWSPRPMPEKTQGSR